MVAWSRRICAYKKSILIYYDIFRQAIDIVLAGHLGNEALRRCQVQAGVRLRLILAWLKDKSQQSQSKRA